MKQIGLGNPIQNLTSILRGVAKIGRKRRVGLTITNKCGTTFMNDPLTGSKANSSENNRYMQAYWSILNEHDL